MADHDAGDAPERRADDEGGGDDAIDIDAHQAGDWRVLSRGAHRHAEFGAVDQASSPHGGSAETRRWRPDG